MVMETLDWIGRLDIFGAPSEPSIDLSVLFREQNKKSGYIYIYPLVDVRYDRIVNLFRIFLVKGRK